LKEVAITSKNVRKYGRKQRNAHRPKNKSEPYLPTGKKKNKNQWSKKLNIYIFAKTSNIKVMICF